MNFEASLPFAALKDEQDSLSSYKAQFHFPQNDRGLPYLYFAGNSLGLQPKKAREYVNQELDDWARLGVEGHLKAKHPWLPYHELLTEQTARLVGAKPSEVVVMNTLSVNLHLMMVSFYRPTSDRFKILIEAGAFPSDQYAVASQAKFHGYPPKEAVLELKPRANEACLRNEDILEFIEKNGKSIALVLLGNVNYLTGQAFDMAAITKAAHAQGCRVGFDLAHGAGNLEFKLHDWDVDFAAWCSYKYLNAGPGALSGCFVHEKFARDEKLPRFEGWWGQNKKTRFEMPAHFDAIPGAEGWQLSNPPILQLAALRASMELFDQATMPALRKRSQALTAYLEFLLKKLPATFASVITPTDPHARGCQLSLKIKGSAKKMVSDLFRDGVIADDREPDIIRIAPTPLYCSYSDIFKFSEILGSYAKL